MAQERRYRAEEMHGLGDNDPAPDYTDGRLEVRPRDFVALADGEHLDLTPLELALLAELTRYEGAVRTRNQLLDSVWGPDATVSARNVDLRVMRLRDKLAERIPDVAYIHTHAGIGYRFTPKPAG
jgi:DNA-binding response OmpR family regulator